MSHPWGSPGDLFIVPQRTALRMLNPSHSTTWPTPRITSATQRVSSAGTTEPRFPRVVDEVSVRLIAAAYAAGPA